MRSARSATPTTPPTTPPAIAPVCDEPPEELGEEVLVEAAAVSLPPPVAVETEFDPVDSGALSASADVTSKVFWTVTFSYAQPGTAVSIGIDSGKLEAGDSQITASYGSLYKAYESTETTLQFCIQLVHLKVSLKQHSRERIRKLHTK